MKINSVIIEGLRGVRHILDLPLAGKSALLYGDNGSGKSSISDVIEWFYFDKVYHLSGEEIGRNGHEAMRNVLLPETQAAKLHLKFSAKDFDAQKSLEKNGEKLKSKNSNDNAKFEEYITHSTAENLVLRYRDLVNFVLASKTDKLKALSDIIGYSEITATRDTFKTVRNGLEKEIKTKAFDEQISHQQSQIIEQFKQNITSDKQFLDAVAKIIEPFKLGLELKELKDVNAILPKIKKPDDSKEVKQEAFLVKLTEKFLQIPAHLDEIEKDYSTYKTKFDALVSDIEKLKKLSLEKLLSIGKTVLEDKGYTAQECPLCLSDIDKKDILSVLGVRITELQEIKNEQVALSKSKEALDDLIQKTLKVINLIAGDEQIEDAQNEKLKQFVEAIQSGLGNYSASVKVKAEDGKKLKVASELKVDGKNILDAQKLAATLLEELRAKRKVDPKWDAYNKIVISGHAYAEIKKLKKEQAAYQAQLVSMDALHGAFQKTQKKALELFLNTFSGRIDEIYQYLNPDEKVENIRLVPLERDDELLGITIQFDFLGAKDVSPPHKLLSESHLNCVGIAFFLSSVEAFNKRNKFLVLDDVISSFDINHRKRFADLLIEQYADYQIILLTHERHWFDLVHNLVRPKGWFINALKHDDTKGTYIDDVPSDLKSKIEKKIAGKIEDGLGNDARKYLEHLLKEIALNMEVKVNFRFNDINEDRMAYELLTELKSTLAKRKCTELQSSPVIDRLLASMFIGNKDSHDSSFVPKFADMKAFWSDVQELQKLFYCSSCAQSVSLKYYDSVHKKIRCKDGLLSYVWGK